jgi:hypothetical protein
VRGGGEQEADGTVEATAVVWWKAAATVRRGAVPGRAVEARRALW